MAWGCSINLTREFCIICIRANLWTQVPYISELQKSSRAVCNNWFDDTFDDVAALRLTGVINSLVNVSAHSQ